MRDGRLTKNTSMELLWKMLVAPTRGLLWLKTNQGTDERKNAAARNTDACRPATLETTTAEKAVETTMSGRRYRLFQGFHRMMAENKTHPAMTAPHNHHSSRVPFRRCRTRTSSAAIATANNRACNGFPARSSST